MIGGPISEETLRRWRTVGVSVPDLSGPGIEPQDLCVDRDVFSSY